MNIHDCDPWSSTLVLKLPAEYWDNMYLEQREPLMFNSSVGTWDQEVIKEGFADQVTLQDHSSAHCTFINCFFFLYSEHKSHKFACIFTEVHATFGKSDP